MRKTNLKARRKTFWCCTHTVILYIATLASLPLIFPHLPTTTRTSLSTPYPYKSGHRILFFIYQHFFPHLSTTLAAHTTSHNSLNISLSHNCIDISCREHPLSSPQLFHSVLTPSLSPCLLSFLTLFFLVYLYPSSPFFLSFHTFPFLSTLSPFFLFFLYHTHSFFLSLLHHHLFFRLFPRPVQ